MRVRQGLQAQSAVRRRPLRLAGRLRRGPSAAAPGLGRRRVPLPQYAVEPAQAMFRFGPTHRGRSPFVLPAVKPAVWWTFATGGPIVSSPAVGADGSVLVGSQDGKLYDVARDGTLKWSYATGDIIFSSPAVAHDGTIYIGSDDDHLYAVTPAAAKPRWIVQMGACPQRVGIGPEASRCDVDAGPDRRARRRHLHGRRRHLRHQPGRHSALALRRPADTSRPRPPCCPDGTVVAGSQDDLVYAIAPNGQKRWDFRAGADIEAAPAIGDDGTIYVGSDDDKLYALAPDGDAALGVHHRRRRARIGGDRQRHHLRRLVRRSTLRRPSGRHAGVDIPRRRSHRVVGAGRRDAAPSCSARRTTAFIVSSLTAICAGRWSSAATSTARRPGRRRHHLRGLRRPQALRAARAERIAAPRQASE